MIFTLSGLDITTSDLSWLAPQEWTDIYWSHWSHHSISPCSIPLLIQGQVDDRDRTIRLQRDLIEQLEAEKRQKVANGSGGDPGKELISMATQTERVSWAFGAMCI